MLKRSSSSSSRVLGLLAAPPAALAAFGLLVGLGVPPVAGWFWPRPDTNLAEAAAMGDAARVRSLSAAGASLDAPQRVRLEIRGDGAPLMMTALQAAVRYGHEDVAALLAELGATPPAGATAAAP